MRNEDIISRISQAVSIEELDKVTFALSKYLGMDGYYYCNFKPMSGLSTIDHRDDEWLKRYNSKGYHQFDIVTQKLFASDQSFTWEDIVMSDDITKRQMQVLGEARDFGLNHGYHSTSKETPFQGGSSCYYTHDSKDFGDVMLTNKKSLDILSHSYHEKYEEFQGEQKTLPKLAPREAECLTLAALGKTNDEIGTILSLSANTINSYISSASHKLGVRTKIHAVVKAVQLQIIFPF